MCTSSDLMEMAAASSEKTMPPGISEIVSSFFLTDQINPRLSTGNSSDNFSSRGPITDSISTSIGGRTSIQDIPDSTTPALSICTSVADDTPVIIAVPTLDAEASMSTIILPTSPASNPVKSVSLMIMWSKSATGISASVPQDAWLIVR